MFSVAGRLVAMFSLLSTSMDPVELIAIPKFAAGLFSHACTCAVTSSVTKVLEAPTEKPVVQNGVPEIAGEGARVVVTSDHGLFTTEKFSTPGVTTLLTKTVICAPAICAAVVPAGMLARRGVVCEKSQIGRKSAGCEGRCEGGQRAGLSGGEAEQNFVVSNPDRGRSN